ncbi:cytochrome P450 [Prauserella rugosa]|uniref:Cytochrome P450 n=1 Tax=Prauserella rugosa TaxID=43354 RepID=A0A660CFY6_9PSEU|nr:cytochrome P450 [Prauserella rugosa]TWH20429.1 cytochrome P450 [Prauserella rugosa]
MTLAKQAVRWGVTHAIPRTALRAAARKGDLQARLFIESAQIPTLGLTGLFDEIHGREPVVRGQYSYLVSRHPIVREVLTSQDVRAGVDRVDGVFGTLGRWAASDHLHPIEPPSLLATEPPDHTRYRKLVTRVFTARAVERLRERTEEIAAELLDRMAERADRGEPVDLVESYCSLLPVTVIAEILGVPSHERDTVLRLGTAAAPSLDMGMPWRQFRETDSALQEFDEWLGGHLAALRAEPGDNLLSQLVAAREDGVGLDDKELRATAGLVLAAGFETTVNLLGNGVALLRDHPEQLDKVRQDASLWPGAVDEMLRVDPPVLLTGRTVVRDTEFAGTPVRAGSVVTTLLAGANRDPAVFDDPHTFDVTRPNSREHISFSSGRHYCLGAALARMEGEVGLRALFDRFPDLTLLPGAQHRPTRILRGYERLPARLS